MIGRDLAAGIPMTCSRMNETRLADKGNLIWISEAVLCNKAIGVDVQGRCICEKSEQEKNRRGVMH